MSQFPHDPNIPPRPTRPRSEKSLLSQMLDLLACVLAFFIALIIAPSLVTYSSGFFINFMSATLAPGFDGLYGFVWWMIVFMSVGASSFLFISSTITGFFTNRILRKY